MSNNEITCNVKDCFAYPEIASGCPFANCDNCVHNSEGDREQCNYENIDDIRKRGEEGGNEYKNRIRRS